MKFVFLNVTEVTLCPNTDNTHKIIFSITSFIMIFMSIRQDAIKHAIVASLFKTRNREFKENCDSYSIL